MYTIQVETIEELVDIAAGLVKQGICFNVKKVGRDYKIEMTGGY